MDQSELKGLNTETKRIKVAPNVTYMSLLGIHSTLREGQVRAWE